MGKGFNRKHWRSFYRYDHPDTQPPILSIEDSPEEYTNASTLSVSFTVDNASEIRLSGHCGSDNFTNLSTGSIDLSNLSEGYYSNCSLEAFDLAGNTSGSQSISSFTFDETPPDNLSLVLNGGDNQTTYGKY